MDIKDWCGQCGLGIATATQLRQEGFATAEDLLHVTEDDIRVTFQKSRKLTLQQCVALREALGDFQRGTVKRRPREGLSVAEWCMRHGLDAETRKSLEKEGFNTADDIKYITAEDVKTTFQKTATLPLQQCIALRNALNGDNLQVKGTADSGGTSCREAANREAGGRQKVNKFASSLVTNTRPPVPHPRTRRTRGDHIAPEYRLVVVGSVGSGKSSTVRSILDHQDSSFPPPQHGDSHRGTLHRGHCQGHLVHVLDSNDWLTTGREHTDMANIITADMQQLRPGPHAVLYTVDISSRYTKGDVTCFKQLEAVFNHYLHPFLIVVFTHGDSLRGSGKHIEDLIETAPSDLQRVLSKCQDRYVVLDNTKLQPKQVEKLLLLLQHQTSQNLPDPYFPVENGREGADEMANRLLQVEEELMESTLVVSARRQAQKEERRQMTRSLKVLNQRARQSSRQQKELHSIQTSVDNGALHLHNSPGNNQSASYQSDE